MNAIVFERFGGPDVLQYCVVPDPVPSQAEVLVRVKAVSVNRTLDGEVREKGAGFGVALPHISGADPAGEVAAVGRDVAGLKVSTGSPSIRS